MSDGRRCDLLERTFWFGHTREMALLQNGHLTGTLPQARISSLIPTERLRYERGFLYRYQPAAMGLAPEDGFDYTSFPVDPRLVGGTQYSVLEARTATKSAYRIPHPLTKRFPDHAGTADIQPEKRKEQSSAEL